MSRENGFTLLEVLVAFIIAAAALAVLFGGALDGLTAARTAGRYEQALARAQSRLAGVGRMAPLAAGSQEGDEDGYHWQVRVVPVAVASPPAGAAPRQRPVLFAVSVAVSWPGGTEGRRQVLLESSRLGWGGTASLQ